MYGSTPPLPGFNGIWIHGLCIGAAVLYPLHFEEPYIGSRTINVVELSFKNQRLSGHWKWCINNVLLWGLHTNPPKFDKDHECYDPSHWWWDLYSANISPPISTKTLIFGKQAFSSCPFWVFQPIPKIHNIKLLWFQTSFLHDTHIWP